MTSAWHQEPLRVRPQKARRETLADMYIVDAPLQLPCAAPGANIDADWAVVHTAHLGAMFIRNAHSQTRFKCGTMASDALRRFLQCLERLLQLTEVICSSSVSDHHAVINLRTPA